MKESKLFWFSMVQSSLGVFLGLLWASGGFSGVKMMGVGVVSLFSLSLLNKVT